MISPNLQVKALNCENIARAIAVETRMSCMMSSIPSASKPSRKKYGII
jgi:hypothetical protein